MYESTHSEFLSVKGLQVKDVGLGVLKMCFVWDLGLVEYDEAWKLKRKNLACNRWESLFNLCYIDSFNAPMSLI